MLPRISFKRAWSDQHVAEVTIQTCDGVSTFVSKAYVPLDWGATAAVELRAFGKKIYGGLYDLEAGGEGPEYAGGGFNARFHFYRPNRLLISISQHGDFFPFKESLVASNAKMFLRTEPALLDNFILALPSLDRADGADAILEGVPLGT